MSRHMDSSLLALTHALVGDIRCDDSWGASIARRRSSGELTKLTRHRAPGTALLVSLALKKKL
ncbi:hypothetical protein [Xanthomonas arboricola]|uniref:hypothetical protein n=1 Tax=Xanthomonas arboricola TaxID=56448 RepID=UPI000CEE30FC|nr:hypothetical protein [Xanthomonas arboricola]PPU42111.1 hypothetical protein XaplCFBP3123_03030 [Xanthomonas arboricola pv. populi]